MKVFEMRKETGPVSDS